MPHITVKIPRAGLTKGTSKVEIEGHGFPGETCKEKMKPFIAMFGDSEPDTQAKLDAFAEVEEEVHIQNEI